MNFFEDFDPLIWIIDFGSQYTQLIFRNCREMGYSATILSLEEAQEKISTSNSSLPSAIILSGGPGSTITDDDFPWNFKDLIESDLPILGICYGFQLLAKLCGEEVQRGVQGEYGSSQIWRVDQDQSQHFSIPWPMSDTVWMSRFDEVKNVPSGFKVLQKSNNGAIASMLHQEKPILALQFHPEVQHSSNGKLYLQTFFTDIANLEPDMDFHCFKRQALSELEKIDEGHVLCAFSGGVDSLVTAYLAHEVLGDRLICFFVDHGLLRPQDLKHIKYLQQNSPLRIEIINAQRLFLDELSEIKEPEHKRKVIGKLFIEVFEKEVKMFEEVENIHFSTLLQGTLYPDIIESSSHRSGAKKSATIKSHHNVGGLPEHMNLKICEPLKFFYKDEVRKLGEELGIDKKFLYRHPFPGPGIGIRIMGEITPERVLAVQQSDQILLEEMHAFKIYDKVWQALTVFLPVQTVGIKGDARAYEYVIALRIVQSSDGMTANWAHLPHDFLQQVSSRITNEVSHVTRVVLDITNKPPGTIEWE